MPSSTPNKAWPYPLETDTPDVASDIKSLATAIDVVGKTTSGVLSGLPGTVPSLGDSYLVAGDTTATNNGMEFVSNGSTWQLINQFRLSQIATNTNFSAVAGQLVLYFGTGGATITLPAVSSSALVAVTCVKQTMTSAITIQQAGSAKIFGTGLATSGVTSFQLGIVGATAILESDGANWFIVGGQQDTGWVPMALHTGIPAGTPAPAARVVGDLGMLSGITLTSGSVTIASGTALITIPAACRPPSDQPLTYSGGWGSGIVPANGVLTTSGTSSAQIVPPVAFGGVTYRMT